MTGGGLHGLVPDCRAIETSVGRYANGSFPAANAVTRTGFMPSAPFADGAAGALGGRRSRYLRLSCI